MWNVVISFVHTERCIEPSHWKSIREKFSMRKFPSIVNETSISHTHTALPKVSGKSELSCSQMNLLPRSFMYIKNVIPCNVSETDKWQFINSVRLHFDSNRIAVAKYRSLFCLPVCSRLHGIYPVLAPWEANRETTVFKGWKCLYAKQAKVHCVVSFLLQLNTSRRLLALTGSFLFLSLSQIVVLPWPFP